jgi:hypothetical protein
MCKWLKLNKIRVEINIFTVELHFYSVCIQYSTSWKKDVYSEGNLVNFVGIEINWLY